MKRYPSTPRCFAAMLPFGGALFGWFLVTFGLFTPQLSFGTDRHWNGNTNTTWGTNTNWDTGAPSAGDNAVFNNNFTTSNQPTLTGNASAGGIWMATGVTQNVTISGSGTLTLQGNTINTIAGLGILVDNTNAFTLTINCGLKVGSAQTWTNNSSNLFTVSGAVDTNNKALTINGSGNTTISGVVSGTGGAGTITQAGSGTLILSGSNTYKGATTVSAGILNIQNGAALGSTAAGTTVSSGATLQLQSGITVGAEALTLSGTGATGQNGALVNVSGTNNYGGLLTLGAATTISSDSGTLNLTNTGTITGATFGLSLTGAGNGTVSSIIGTTSGTLTKSGTGTWTLSGTNTYTGTTTVNGGTLLVNGNNSAATGAVSVNNSGTTLGGTGTIGGAVTVASGAKLLGGTGSTASGTLTLASNLTLSSGSIIELALGASGAHSTITRTGGTWTFATSQAFTFINLGAQPGNYTNIITGLGSDPMGESGWTITDTGWIGNFTYNTGNINLTVTAVPEPSTWIAGALALGAVGWTQRRRFSCR